MDFHGFSWIFMDFHGFSTSRSVFNLFSAVFEGLAYNRVAMTSYFQHRSASELALTSLEWLQEKGVEVIFATATAVTLDFPPKSPVSQLFERGSRVL